MHRFVLIRKKKKKENILVKRTFVEFLNILNDNKAIEQFYFLNYYILNRVETSERKSLLLIRT